MISSLAVLMISKLLAAKHASILHSKTIFYDKVKLNPELRRHFKRKSMNNNPLQFSILAIVTFN